MKNIVTKWGVITDTEIEASVREIFSQGVSMSKESNKRLLRDVFPGQEFYHVDHDRIGVRVLNTLNKLTNDDGTIPYLPIGQAFINAGLPTDAVRI